jgi:ribosomal protein L37E
MASSDFTIPTVNCPNCGYPVNTEQCPCCGWARPL